MRKRATSQWRARDERRSPNASWRCRRANACVVSALDPNRRPELGEERSACSHSAATAATHKAFKGHSRTLGQGAARSSDLDFTRGETPKLLEMARSPASALPARPSVLHRCTSSRRCGNCGRTGSRRPGGRRTPRDVRTLVDRRGHAGCRRPGSRRCCPPSHPGRWAQASFLNAGACERDVPDADGRRSRSVREVRTSVDGRKGGAPCPQAFSTCPCRSMGSSPGRTRDLQWPR